MMKTVHGKLGNKEISIETGKLAKQAGGSVFVSYGDTRVIVTATSSNQEKANFDMVPLTVDYIEKYYAAGKIPGGYLKREAKPADQAILNARLIDRPIRPLIQEGYFFETHIVATILSVDPDYSPDQAAMLGASAALMVSDIPFNGPIAGCRVARVDGKFIASPSIEELEKSDMDILVASTESAVAMVEGVTNLISEEDALEAIMFGFESVQPLIKIQKELAKEVGKTKREVVKKTIPDNLKSLVNSVALDKIKKAYSITEKLDRYAKLSEAKSEVVEEVVKSYTDKNQAEFEEQFCSCEDTLKSTIKSVFADLVHHYTREMITKDKTRIDKRKLDQVRPIWCETGLLPRAHGSAVFTRGETQVLAAVTLGSGDDEQFIDALEGLRKDKFMLHYNFPPYSVGEAGGMRPPGRRELGHGNLAKRALLAVMPEHEKFPYTIRVVSEVLESNGSSSMGTVCSSSMALLNAGVPIKAPVAGVAMGLIKENDDFVVLTDILGDEDHIGDMDFKVAGTDSGITAIQMDIKINGVTKDILRTALSQAKDARLHILKETGNTIASPSNELSRFAPKIESISINTDKIKDVIGPGGKVIKSIIEQTGVKVDIQDNGTINIASADSDAIQKTKEIIKGITGEIEIGSVYQAVVKRIMDFGAIVEYLPGKDTLIHISEIAKERVNNVRDYLNEGDNCKIKYLGIDRQGRTKFSIKATLDD